MAARIQDMRALLREGLKEAGSTKDWSHITDQIGMFAYTGLTKEQVQKMRDESAVYCTLDGRISVAGLNREQRGLRRGGDPRRLQVNSTVFNGARASRRTP